MRVVGVDGCRGGWVAVALADGAFAAAGLFPKFVDVLRAWPDAWVVAVDIPIGLGTEAPRAADIAAHALLKGSASTVFLMPSKEVLRQATYAEALALARAQGSGLSRQAYALRPKVLEVEPLVLAQARIREVHPEVSFRMMSDAPVGHPKRTWAGHQERRRLLARVGIVVPDDLGEAGRAGTDDVLDAAAAAWSASRIASGEARTLPEDPPVDASGREVAIWF